MSTWRVRSRPARGDSRSLRIVRDPDLLARHLEDAAHFSGGHARELASPANEAEVAEAVAGASPVLPIGAQSSLTGGATPMGERLVSTARLNHIISVADTTIRVEAGVTLAKLDRALAAKGHYYPPAPTYDGAFIGGTIATNAAGAATFKYGATRNWVRAITVVLPEGDVLDIERHAVKAHPDGYFELELARRTVRVPVPRYTLPQVPKLSAGYFAQPGMDLIDLFIGSEGTLGIVTEATLGILQERPSHCLVFVPFSTRGAALAFVRRLEEIARGTWTSHDPRGIDVSAVEHMDRRCLSILREDGVAARTGVPIPATACVALLVTLELPPGTGPERAYEALGRMVDAERPDGPLARFADLLDAAGVLDDVQIAVPGDATRRAQLLALREAVPAGVNQRIARVKQTVDSSIEKMAADVIVPIARLEEMLDICGAEAERLGLDLAVWGHISDGNLHPNVIPRSRSDIEWGREAVLAFGRAAMRLGGAPMAEHGVGRNPTKQQLLRDMYGEGGIEQMRRVKEAIDPTGKLAPGVIFQRDRALHQQGTEANRGQT